MRPMSKRSGGSRRKASRDAVNLVRGQGTDIRGKWPISWLPLLQKFPTPVDIAKEIGVTYMTLNRWALKGDDIPDIGVFALRCLAEKHGVEPPV